jgi:hypothetical protein
MRGIIATTKRFEGLMIRIRSSRISDAPIAHMPTPEIADSLPEDVPMQDLPAGVTRKIPLVQGYKFVKFDDRILIINPSNRFVVAMMPRYKLVP